MTENRHGLMVDAELMTATGKAEREAATPMVQRREGSTRITVGADKGYDTRGFVADLRAAGATPQVAQNTRRSGGSAIDGRTTRHAGHALSQRKRKLVEEPFGWLKTIANLAQTRHRGQDRVGWVFVFGCCSLRPHSLRKHAAGGAARLTPGRSVPGRAKNGSPRHTKPRKWPH